MNHQRTVLLPAAGLIWLLLAPAAAHAHQIGLSRGAFEVTDNTIRATLTVSRRETTATDLAQRFTVSAGSQACPATLSAPTDVENDGQAIDVRWVCPKDTSPTEIRLARFDGLASGHRHVMSITFHGQPQDAVLSAHNNTITLGAPNPSQGSRFWTFFVTGIEHILTGTDHVVFVLALFLIVGSLRAYLTMITAFTIAHSVTLGVAVLGIIKPSPDLIEPAIALSIAWVGIENFIVKNVDRRWILTATFGLIHGFGFSSALAEIGLKAADLPVTLAAFNLGVETGQLGLLLVFLPLLGLARREPVFVSRGIPLLNAAVIVIGGYWFVQRVFG